ncbi:DUF3307 domain-containing protein [Shimia biformata]|uniref:DUF3307 domain-containing protein n=1 Tax=Shimia biformata TaxID=1294299 RepID=UPI001950C0AB|nr:DUF3307 domain-containing protein [Shimia biformata]
MHSANAILGLLCLFQIKHLLADYFFQTKVMLTGRENYVHLGRALHAGVHALLSIAVLAVFGTPAWLILVLVVGEWVVHFHIDWWKASDTLKKQLTPADAGFWRGFGIDQALHQLTYIGMVWVWSFY